MKIEKLPSGSYRIQKMIDGKRHSITFDHEPKKKEIENAIAELITAQSHNLPKLAFYDCALQYIASRENVASPSTLRGYRAILKALHPSFLDMKLEYITQLDVQKEINRHSEEKSPKTVRNIHGFISAVLKMFNPSLVLRTTLPQKEKIEGYIPTPDDIKLLLDSVRNTPYYIPFRLGCYGLRRSEVLAIRYPESFDGNYLKISHAVVLNSDAEWIEKTTKTTESTRTIYIDDELLECIKNQGYIYKGHPNMLTKTITAKQEQLGLPHFRFHDLRHYFATELSEKGVPEADILALGGWSSPYTMKRVYRHSRAKNDRDAMKNISEIIAHELHTKNE